jgi:hypothetical protein
MEWMKRKPDGDTDTVGWTRDCDQILEMRRCHANAVGCLVLSGCPPATQLQLQWSGTQVVRRRLPSLVSRHPCMTLPAACCLAGSDETTGRLWALLTPLARHARSHPSHRIGLVICLSSSVSDPPLPPSLARCPEPGALCHVTLARPRHIFGVPDNPDSTCASTPIDVIVPRKAPLNPAVVMPNRAHI